MSCLCIHIEAVSILENRTSEMAIYKNLTCSFKNFETKQKTNSRDEERFMYVAIAMDPQQKIFSGVIPRLTNIYSH